MGFQRYSPQHSERPQTHALDRGVTGIGTRINNKYYSSAEISPSNLKFITSYFASHCNQVYNVRLIK
jgi:hypothetical protein